MLITLCFALAVDKSIICNTTQAIEVSKYIVHFFLEHVATAGKSEGQPFPPVVAPWGTESAKFTAFVVEVNLPEPASGIKDPKMGGTTDLKYRIIYGSYIVRGAPNGFVKVTGVQA